MALRSTVLGVFLAFLLALVNALAVCSPRDAAAQATAPAATSPTATSGDFSGLVNIGDGRRLFLECRGDGSPTVILEAGAGNNGQNWETAGLPEDAAQTAVLPGVAAFTRVCAYDRPGTILDLEHRSRSDPALMPRTAKDIVADLHALLTAAAVPGPYVLAGHSFGGLVVRLYAATYPNEVAGLVLVDAAHEDYYAAQQAALTPAQRAEIARLAEEGPPGLADYPDRERLDTDASAAALRQAVAASPLPPMPLVVLTHGRPWDWPPGYPVEDLEALWMPLQEDLAALVPDGRLVVADGSGHFIPGERPDLVIAAIADVVDAVRDPSTWPLAFSATPSAAAGATPIPSASGAQLTPLLNSVLSTPRWFAGSDGQVHLVYELLLTNPLAVPVTVSAVEVRAADAGDALIRLSGESLLAAMSLASTPETPTAVLPPSGTGVVWFDVPLASQGDIPAAIVHQVTIEPLPNVSIPASWLSYTSAATDVDRRPPVVLGAPLTGAGWAALGSCCDGPHRRALQPIDGRWRLAQRFAIDFNQLDAENRQGCGDLVLPISFSTFGQPVFAVADAIVAEAVDRYPDLLVGEAREALTPENAGGNRVVLHLGDGRFAVYAHLQVGSIAVQPGGRIARGQPIANVGSSGTLGGPHLHFQVTAHPSVLVGDGLPYVFDAFELTGQAPPLAEVIPYYDTLEPIPIATERTGQQRNALPLGRDVVSFPAAQFDLPHPDPGDFRSSVGIGGRQRVLQRRNSRPLPSAEPRLLRIERHRTLWYSPASA
jgi:pimeloyl-ACP methyl ester carboxylesterase